MISDPCGTCHGDGRKKKKVDLEVKIPAGIDHGQRLKLTNEGDSGTMGAPAGDLFVVVPNIVGNDWLRSHVANFERHLFFRYD